MKGSEFIDAISKIYIPGVINYYDKLPENPWNRMLDSVERAYETQDEMVIESTIDAAFARARALVERFREDNSPSKIITNVDAFVLGRKEYDKRNSRINQQCIECESKEDLTLVDRGDDKTPEIVIICKECKDGSVI